MNKTFLTLALSLLIPAAAAQSTKPTPYQPYTQKAFDAAAKEQRVLFFHATWCPTCKRSDADITANLAKLPAGIVIFKTDYDKELALKKKYGVTYQHTFVLVDAKGNALKKWAGGGMKEILDRTVPPAVQ